jgi:S-adenosylmethionine:tRNA ribosyltransferase-isomerase
MQNHDMHAEEFSISLEQLALLKKSLEENRPIIVVGTTSMRALESLFWVDKTRALNDVEVSQWLPYSGNNNEAPITKIGELINSLNNQNLTELHGKTRIIIAPSYNFKFATALITNFHQPKSTLLLLVSALIGNNWKTIYKHALNNNFRFLSYGDSSLLWNS